MDIENLWNNFLNNISKQIDKLAFDTWFQETKLISLDNGEAKVLVPMNIHKKHLSNTYLDLIENTFNALTGTNFNFEFIIEDEWQDESKEITEETGVPQTNADDAKLNSSYNFDSFVVGASNKFAHAAAVAVAENPGKMYNPLFIYGNSGLGKTHLMQAIGNYILKNTNKRVLYVTSDNFISDFIDINKDKKNNFDYVNRFKKKYRDIDVLIIDDIQFLGGATQTQQEFFHTFNNLYNDEKQILISSDRSPDDLKILEDRLRTRFNWGLTVNISPPDFQLRYDILKKKIAGQGLTTNFPDNVIDYIANNCASDIRQLEGAITRLYAYATMMNGSDITLELAIEALKDYLGKNLNTKNKIQHIQYVVANYYKITVEDLKSKKRKNDVAIPRQIAMYLCREMTDESFPKIGIEFGKDHSTVVHACDKIRRDLEKETNRQLKEVIRILKEKINSC